jgi:hypothetical protein
VAELDAAGGDSLIRRHFGLEAGGVMLLVGCRVGLRPRLDERGEVLLKVDVGGGRARLDEIGVAIDPAFPGLRQDDELVAEIPPMGPVSAAMGMDLAPMRATCADRR